MIDAKNTMLIGAVLFVAAIIGLYIPYVQYHKSENARPLVATSTSDGARVVIIYTNGGFEPREITVSFGTTVEWINTSDKLMWAASDEHPSHTDLPGFDQRGTDGNEIQSLVPVAYAHAAGGGYVYTFTKVGTWKYHNHLVPADRGTIVVEEP